MSDLRMSVAAKTAALRLHEIRGDLAPKERAEVRGLLLDERVRQVVDAAPPLSDEQRMELARLFGNGQMPNCAPVRPDARPRPEPRVALYRRWDADDVLLYIGISVDPDVRRRSHDRRSVWTEFAVREEIEWHPDRATAEAAERAAIIAEKPLFNGQHTTQEAQIACIEYLIKRGRVDLLRFGGPRG